MATAFTPGIAQYEGQASNTTIAPRLSRKLVSIRVKEVIVGVSCGYSIATQPPPIRRVQPGSRLGNCPIPELRFMAPVDTFSTVQKESSGSMHQSGMAMLVPALSSGTRGSSQELMGPGGECALRLGGIRSAEIAVRLAPTDHLLAVRIEGVIHN